MHALVELVRLPYMAAPLAVYLERLVPRVFVRLTDLRENVRQVCTAQRTNTPNRVDGQ